jgi:basic membrane lipoprotein Med (substrate-binding protein (PBP1-ABC) superfamily)
MSSQKRHNNLPSRKQREKDTKLREATARGISGGARRCRSHPKTTIGVAAALVTIGAAALLTGHQPHSATAVDPRTHVTVNYTACLLTDTGGITTEPALAAWEGMQTATASTNERVTNQAVIGAQTPHNATAFINTLAAQKCAVIIAVSKPIVEAAVAEASTYPAIRFIVITSATLPKRAPGNMSHIQTADDQTVANQVATALIADFKP